MKVFEPITINKIEVRNRIAYTAHGTHLSTHGYSEAAVAYMVARARGGCGLAISEGAAVHLSAINTRFNISDIVIPGFRKMAKEVHAQGMRMFQQLWHGGHTAFALGKRPSWAPSAVAGPEAKGVPIPMNEEQIEILIQAYAAAAARCQEGGLDGVELHGAHGYLPHQFLSPLVNRREDRWGGSVQNRMRFVQETLRAIRKRVGPDFVVGIRLSASEMKGSVDEADLKQVIAALEKEKLIDFLNASHGDYYNMHEMVGTMSLPLGYELPSSGQLADGVSVPRIVAGRFRTLEEANQVIREGTADMVSLVRAQIADPNLVRKTMEGRVEEVRPCIGCNQGCVGGLFRDNRLGCTVNPAVGFEEYLNEELIQPAAKPRKILVIGGGPAGMEAARVAALQGHKVILAEAGSRLGGQINVAKVAPFRHGIGDIIDWQERTVYRLGVDVRMGTYMEADDVLAEKADTIIIATGSMPRTDGFQAGRPGELAKGVDLPHVLTSTDLLMGPSLNLGKQVLILDDVGHYEAIACADYLFHKGVAVTWVTRHPNFAPLMQHNFSGDHALDRLYKHDFTLIPNHHLAEIRAGEVVIHPLRAPENRKTIRADTVVMVTYNEPVRGLYDELYGRHADLHLIGDALSPRDLQYAIADGHRAVRPEVPVVGDQTPIRE